MKTRGGSMKVGRTIAEERERLESESERNKAREKAKSRQKVTVVVFIIGAVVIGILVTIGIRSLAADNVDVVETETETYEPTVEIVDEAGTGVTKRTREFIGKLERDFSDLGYKVTRVAVPTGKRREVDVYLDGISYYIKMNIDRSSAVSAEDADRMIRYLAERGLAPGYVDVRVEGKGYYR